LGIGSADVEGIIGLMHEMLGDIFDMKQFIDAQRKIFNEFTKRIDPDLKFLLLVWNQGTVCRFRIALI
jgi:hypothetical protein